MKKRMITAGILSMIMSCCLVSPVLPEASFGAAVSAETKPFVTSSVSGSTVELEWDALANASQYSVYEYRNGKYIKIGSTKKTRVIVTNASNGEHYYTVRACVSGKWSDVKKEDLIKVTVGSGSEASYSDSAVGQPGKVTSTGSSKPFVYSYVNGSTVELQWNMVTDATQYRVYEYKNGKLSGLGYTAKTRASVNNVTNGVHYYAVRAYVNNKWTAVKKSDLIKVTVNNGITYATAYEAYAAEVKKYIEEYGRQQVLQNEDGSYSLGGTLVRLLDMDNDGTEELILGYPLKNSSGYIDIYTYSGGKAVKAYSGYCDTSALDGTASVTFISFEKEYLLAVGNIWKDKRMYFYGLRDNVVRIFHTIMMTSEQTHTFDGMNRDFSASMYLANNSGYDHIKYTVSMQTSKKSSLDSIVAETNAAMNKIGIK